jgi:hypothetical protein
LIHEFIHTFTAATVGYARYKKKREKKGESFDLKKKKKNFIKLIKKLKLNQK